MPDVDGQAAFRAAVLAAGGQVNGEPTSWVDPPVPAPRQPTQAQLAERVARHVEWDRQKRAEKEAVGEFAEALASVVDPVARAVLDLHKDDSGICADEQDWDGYGPSWPCQTVLTVATAVGIPVPAHLVD